jgi:methylase of polypeptide subunit release factors
MTRCRHEDPAGARFDPSQMTPDVGSALRSALASASYAKTVSLPVPGPRHHLAVEALTLWRFLTSDVNVFNHSRAASVYRAIVERRIGTRALVLHDLFWRGTHVARDVASSVLDDMLVDSLEKATLIRTTPTDICATARCVPLRDMFLLFDLERRHPDFVYFGKDSIRLVDLVERLSGRRTFRRALDLCTGSGVQGLAVARRSHFTACVDINERAVAFARANAVVNDLPNVAAIAGDGLSSVAGSFDCITANTPYVPMPRDPSAADLPLRGGDLGIEFALRLLERVPALLARDGIAFIYTVDPIKNGERQLRPAVRSMLDSAGMRVTEVLLSRGFPNPRLREHFARVGLDAYDDCVLVLQHADRFDYRVQAWSRMYYHGTKLKSHVASTAR